MRSTLTRTGAPRDHHTSFPSPKDRSAPVFFAFFFLESLALELALESLTDGSADANVWSASGSFRFFDVDELEPGDANDNEPDLSCDEANSFFLFDSLLPSVI